MPQQTIWLSYDLGVRGDYAGLYTWLDTHKAKECGDSVALFSYEYRVDPAAELLEDLRTSMELNNRTRFYAIYRDPQSDTRKGRFILGGRKASPWTGYAPESETEDDEVSE